MSLEDSFTIRFIIKVAEKFVVTVKSGYKAFVGLKRRSKGMDLVANKAGCGYCK